MATFSDPQNHVDKWATERTSPQGKWGMQAQGSGGATPLPWGTHLEDAARPGPSLPRASSRESQQPLPGGDPAPSLRDSHLRAQGKRPNARGAHGCETLLSAWASGHPARLPVMHANKKQGSCSPGGGPGRWVGRPREPVKKALVGWGPETETQQPRVPIPAVYELGGLGADLSDPLLALVEGSNYASLCPCRGILILSPTS